MNYPAHASGADRIALLHAMPQSMPPIAEAFAKVWPEANCFNVLDDALAPDLDRLGRVTRGISARVVSLARHAVNAGRSGPRTSGMIFTGTAFGLAVKAARSAVSVPLISPNEAAFAKAAAGSGSIALLVTFKPSVEALTADMYAAIETAGSGATLEVHHVPEALDALRGGDAIRHDELISAMAANCVASRIVLGQFSMARAAGAVHAATGRLVITTTESAVLALRSQLEHPTQ